MNLKHPLFISGSLLGLVIFLSFIASSSKNKNNLNTIIDRHCKNLMILLKKQNKNPIQMLSQHVCIITVVKSLKTMTSSKHILKKYQIDFSNRYKNCCIEGRDISTNILPRSDVKFFFKCNLNLAARRRYKELKKINPKIDLKGVKKALRVRNSLDKKRKNSPLLKHRDSVVIDTGKLDKQAMLVKMSKTVERTLKNKYGNRTRN